MIFKNFILSLFTAVGLIGFGQETFSGTQVISYSYEGEGAEMMAQYMPQGMTSYYGKDKFAIDFNGAAMETIMSRMVTTSTGSFAVNNTQKAIYNIEQDDLQSEELQSQMPQYNVLKSEGETKEFLGLTCEKYQVTMTQMGMDFEMVMWVSTKYVLPEYNVPFNQDMSVKMLKDSDIKGIVMRVESMIPMPGASITMVMETTKLDTTPVDDSIFEKPAGYTEKSFADMQLGGY